jgi:hypothetical protein
MTGHTPIFGKEAEETVAAWSPTQVRQYVIENGIRLDIFGYEFTDNVKEVIIAEGEFRINLLRQQV